MTPSTATRATVTRDQADPLTILIQEVIQEAALSPAEQRFLDFRRLTRQRRGRGLQRYVETVRAAAAQGRERFGIPAPVCDACGDTTLAVQDGALTRCPACAGVDPWPRFACGHRIGADSPDPEHHCCTCGDFRSVQGPQYEQRDGRGRLVRDILPCPDCHTLTPEQRLSRFFREARIDPILRDWTLDRWAQAPGKDQRALAIARAYARHWNDPARPPWLVFAGGVGTGKTTLAAAIARACHEREHVGVRMWVVPDLLAEYRATFNRAKGEPGWSEEALTHDLQTIDLLVLDDLASEHGTEWAHSQLFMLLDHRRRHRRATIITTNAQTEEDVSERLFSRFTEPSICTRVQFHSADRRAGAQPAWWAQ